MMYNAVFEDSGRHHSSHVIKLAFASFEIVIMQFITVVISLTMPAPRKKPDPSGLGRAIINRKVKDARARAEREESGLYNADQDSTTRLQSVTQERDLDEFLNTAQLAGTDFTAERRNIKIIQSGPTGSNANPYLLSEQEEQSTIRKHQENKERLRVPRRPPWTRDMKPAQLERQERDAFLEWRRGLAQLQEEEKFLLTPFERNLEVWRQLWRVLERSHLVVQIVDARNPLRFRAEDLENYVRDVEGPEGEKGTGPGKRRTLLLINKSDLLTATQRRIWADYFDKQNIQYAFFSAANAVALQEARREAIERANTEQAEGVEQNQYPPEVEEGDDPTSPIEDDLVEDEEESSHSSEDPDIFYDDHDTPDAKDPRTKVLTVLELEDLFVKSAPPLEEFTDASGKCPSKLVVGLVGYPNVGKSSTINSLVGEKKVSVSSTPGKTKHFQTIHLSPTMVLCDCPGLVFPQFATTKADLVCDGVLPIDQLREHTGPTSLIVRRIPREVLEATYGLMIRVHGPEEGGNGKITAEDLLVAYAVARGFTRAGQGNPDEARAARYILKDYVNAKLLYCHPPPDYPPDAFNEVTHQISLRRYANKKTAPTTRVGKGADTYIASPADTVDPSSGIGQSRKSKAIDKDFFTSGYTLSARPFVQGSARNGMEYSRSQLFPHQNAVTNDGTPINGKYARVASVIASAGGDASVGKKHHKKVKRVKQRSGKGYDD